MIKVRNVTKRFGPTVAVNNISFDVRQGEILGFLGPNGAGKTTTMKILTCYLPADSGSVEVAGFDILENSLEVRQRVGYLPENNPLYLDIGVVDYLLFVAAIRGIPSDKRLKKVKDMVGICSLEREITKDIGELSRGYRQRVGLAQTLIHDPDILVLDEPTSGLDPNQIIEIRELIKKIGKEKTTILSTHILPEVTATCDRAIIINDGVLVADGTPEQLIRKGRGTVSLFTKLNGPPDVVQKKLKALDTVEDVRVVSSEPGGFSRYEVKPKDIQDPSEEIFHLAVTNQWTLTELSREHVSLEEVFKQLTTKEKTPERAPV
jgi:ABC-2 type transport system ATP-binding protein